jgi:hypothetical protein
MTYYRGIELHSTNSVIVVTDGADGIVFKRRLPNELRLIVKALAPLGAALAVTEFPRSSNLWSIGSLYGKVDVACSVGNSKQG